MAGLRAHLMLFVPDLMWAHSKFTEPSLTSRTLLTGNRTTHLASGLESA